MNRNFGESSDYSDDDSSIIISKKAMVITDTTDDEENDTDDEKSQSIIDDSPIKNDKSESSLLITSTPDDVVSKVRGKSYFSASVLEKQSVSNSLSQSKNDEVESDKSNLLSISEYDKKHMGKKKESSLTSTLKKYDNFGTQGRDQILISSDSEDAMKPSNRGRSFMTPQNKKVEIENSDTEDSDLDSDIIDTSQILDDSFNAETPKPKTQNENSVIVSSDSDEVDTIRRTKDNKQSKGSKMQTKLDDLFKKLEPPSAQKKSIDNSQKKVECKRTEYNDQLMLVRSKEQEMLKAQKIMSTINISNLPDKGLLLKKRFEETKAKFLEAQDRLRNMIVAEEDVPVEQGKKPVVDWNNLEAGIAIVQPKTYGKKGLENYQNQKALTVESLEQLHGSLKNCPKDDQMADEPKGIKVTLMDHQRRALAWLMYREEQKPPGGILADDMGLGKTLTMISLVLKTKENEIDHDDERDEEKESLSKRHRKYNGGTLVVCPASLLNQWAQEIDVKLRRGMLSYNVYHGPKREDKPKRLAEHDVVITTYSIVMNEMEREGAIFRVRWRRIILDEAHQIRNHKAQTSIACCALTGKYRWALTGTPVHNKELDMYALLKFLRCSPFDDLGVWKRWVGDKGSGGGERLTTVISSLMLRRTKAELMAKGELNSMPTRKWDLIPVTLDESEMSLYQKILLFSQTLFAQFLHQRAEKNQDIINFRNPNADTNSEYFKMRKKLLALNQMREVNQHEILVLLLRLRQICCHPSLITNMLQGDEDLGDDEPEEQEEINLLDQLNKLNLDDQPDISPVGEVVGFKEATKGILNPSHPLFAKDRMSSKVKSAMQLIPNILSSGDKIIVVSQWTSFLELFGWHLKEAGIKFTKLDGKVPTSKRTEMVTNFNDPNTKVKVLLLSLTAGGVGLNLVGANHLFLLDLHWNPQLENQAQDRIYRMGQKKNVNIYKFMASETIEERIKKLQENKIQISESMLTGSKHAIGSKLSLQDLKMLFSM
ncbi:transcription termination factor 2 [Coccinella septempunctata]|uniref:transcription termination factor 2 n=1 Tax=Coccinella septempunctata TaxID=41139 RepID=UPI001D0770E4|nr:transcription termination factor 2 [Coccinella septempunctata]